MAERCLIGCLHCAALVVSSLGISPIVELILRGLICLAHIRFRSAIKSQHRGALSLEDLPYRAVFGVYGSWIGFILCVLCILAQIYTSCSPGGKFGVAGFFQGILALPIVVFCYVVWKVWKRPSIVKVVEADL